MNEAGGALKTALVAPRRPVAAKFGAGTLLMEDAPKRAPEPPSPSPPARPVAAPEPIVEPAVKKETSSAPAKKGLAERTMTLGLDVAPGFSVDEIVEQEMKRRRASVPDRESAGPRCSCAGAARGATAEGGERARSEPGVR